MVFVKVSIKKSKSFKIEFHSRYPRFGMYVLQRLHGQSRGIHSLIFCLNIGKDLLFFISSGTKSQILDAR